MKKLILLALLIVGCDFLTEPQDELKGVNWVYMRKPLQYAGFGGTSITPPSFNFIYTEGFEPTIVQVPQNPYDPPLNYFLIEDDTLASYLQYQDYLANIDSVRTIIHNVDANVFEVYDIINGSTRYDPKQYEVFKYEYKQ